jgi:membrane protease YdiL (CAAX protease family)
MVTARISTVTLLASVAAIVAVELAQAALQSVVAMPALAATGVNRLLQTALVAGIVMRSGSRLAPIGLSSSTLSQGLLRGLLWSAGFGLAAAAGFAVLSLLGGQPFALVKSNLPRQPQKIVLLFIVGGLIAPVAEEIFFRGVLYGFLRRWGAPVAILVSTAVFVTLHPTAGLSVTQLVGGLVFAVAYEIEGNLVVPIAIHVLGNNALFALSLMY